MPDDARDMAARMAAIAARPDALAPLILLAHAEAREARLREALEAISTHFDKKNGSRGSALAMRRMARAALEEPNE